MSVEKCDNCAFGVRVWLHYGYRIDCHRKAPIAVHCQVGRESKAIGDGPNYTVAPIMGEKTIWPEVKADDFCGEWELRDAT